MFIFSTFLKINLTCCIFVFCLSKTAQALGNISSGCILYIRINQGYINELTEALLISKASNLNSYNSLVISAKYVHLISRHNSHTGISLISQSLVVQDETGICLDYEIKFGGFISVLFHLFSKPGFIFVLVLRENMVQNLSLFCLSYVTHNC